MAKTVNPYEGLIPEDVIDRMEQQKTRPHRVDGRRLTRDQTWVTVRAFLDRFGLASHQIESFNQFVLELLPDIVQDTSPQVFVTPNPNPSVLPEKPFASLSPANKIKALNEAAQCTIDIFRILPGVRVGYPTCSASDSNPVPITPHQAHIEKLTYFGPMTINVVHKKFVWHPDRIPKPTQVYSKCETHCIGMLPIMVGSVRCWTKHPGRLGSVADMKYDEMDPGGYFIVNGIEKVLISQEHMCQNMVNVFGKKQSGKDVLVAELRSAKGDLRGTASQFTLKTQKQYGMLYRPETNANNVSYVRGDVPIWILLRALGNTDDEFLYNVLGCLFYDTFDLDLVRAKIDGPIQDVEYAFKSFLDTNKQSADALLGGSHDATDAKRWLADRAQQQYAELPRKMANIENILIVHLLPHLNTSSGAPGNKSASTKKYSLSQLDPNVRLDSDTAKRKTMFILQMIVRLWKVQTGLLPEDDRDSHSHKDFYASGTLLAQLFSQHYYKMLKDVRKYLGKCAKTGKPLSFGSGLKMKTITHGLLYAMSTGNWPNHKTAVPNTGVCQALNRLNRIALLSHLRRLNTPIDKSNSRVMSPRHLHGRYFGYICPNETPEGEPIGLVKNMAMSCLFTVDHDMGLISYLLQEENLMPYERILDWMSTLKVDEDTFDKTRPTKRARTETNNFDWKSACLVSLNGFYLGYHSDGMHLCRKLKEYRQNGIIAPDTCILYVDKKMPELVIKCDGGRQCRPVYRLKDRKVRLAEMQLHKLVLGHTYRFGWEELVGLGTIELIDALETEYALIAELPDQLLEPENWTHMSLDPCMLLGVSASQIPFPDANQAPRNTYQSAMAKQAQAAPSYDADHRMDNMSLKLWYPQKPLCMTRMAEELGATEVPTGQNLITAIGCFGADNIEDAIIINKAFIDRGGGRSYIMRAITIETKKHAANSYELFEKPNKEEVVGMKQGSYDIIDDDGLPLPGQTIEPEAVIAAKTQPGSTSEGNNGGGFGQGQFFEEQMVPSSSSNHDKSYRDFLQEKARAEQSELTKRKDRSQVWNHHASVVDKVAIANTAQGGRIVKVRTREMHVPDRGDKLCLTPDHQVLTTEGWKPVAAVTTSDWLATLNPVTMNMSYRRPTTVYEFCHDGLIANVESELVSQVVTLNHRMLVKFQDSEHPEFRSAAHLYLANPSERRYPLGHAGVQHHYSRPLAVISSNEYKAIHLWPFVIANADSLSVTDHGLLIRNLSNEQVQLIAKGLSAADSEWGVQLFSSNGEALIEDTDSVFSKWIDERGLRLPNYLFDLDSNTASLLVRYVASHQRRLDRFVTRQQRLADDFQRLVLHVGRSSQVHPVLIPNTRSYFFEVAYSPTRWTDWVKGDINLNSYQGLVHCVEVPNHVFMVRRNGKASWTGNSSRHGQKGTLGRIYNAEDMPFDVQSGMIPDLIINPHAFVSRMTYGNVREDLLSLVAALQGRCKDGTPFQEYYDNKNTESTQVPKELNDILDEVEIRQQLMAGQSCMSTIDKEEGDELVMDAVSRILKHYGYDSMGKSAMINGQTGKHMQARLFMAPCYYYFLKHLADQKMHARSRGPRQIITKQPAEGRARGGGLRFGEMERDTLIAHGASMSIIERLLYNSDLAKAHFCDNCGDLCIEEVLTNERGQASVIVRCRSCPFASATKGKFSNVHKVLSQDLQGLNYRSGVRVDKPLPFPLSSASTLKMTYAFLGYEGTITIKVSRSAKVETDDVKVIVDDENLVVPFAGIKATFMNIDDASNHFVLMCILSFYQMLAANERHTRHRDTLNGHLFVPRVASEPDGSWIGRWKDYAFTWSV